MKITDTTRNSGQDTICGAQKFQGPPSLSQERISGVTANSHLQSSEEKTPHNIHTRLQMKFNHIRIYTERQKKLITSSGRLSLKSTA